MRILLVYSFLIISNYCSRTVFKAAWLANATALYSRDNSVCLSVRPTSVTRGSVTKQIKLHVR